MNRQSWFFFLLLTNWAALLSQSTFDFSAHKGEWPDGWRGDTSHFVIAENQLRLSASAGGQSTVFIPFELSQAFEWHAFVKLDFAPSKTNRVRLYFWCESMDLDTGDAVFFELGEGGSDDAPILMQRIQGREYTMSKLGSGRFGDHPVFNLRVGFSAPGIWSMAVDCDGNGIFFDELWASSDDISEGPAFFGIQCIYTASRANRFYFDDLTFGPFKSDTRPPRIVNHEVDSGSIKLWLNEFVYSHTVDNASISMVPQMIDSIHLDTAKSLIHIYGTFPQQEMVSLIVTGLRDPSHNSLDTVLNMRIPSPPTKGNLLINEVLFNPGPGGVDFVEILNGSDRLIDLKGLTIINDQNGQHATIRYPLLLSGNEMIALSEDSARLALDFPKSLSGRRGVLDLPALNNTTGLVSLMFGQEKLEEFEYLESLHHPLLKDPDGVSLERISRYRGSEEASNWTSASALAGYGTPGLVNSVNTTGSRRSTFALEHQTFSPDGDGFRDEMVVNYTMAASDVVAGTSVYDVSGRMLFTLHEPKSIGSSGSITWDGKNDRGEELPVGIYIVVIEGLSPSGSYIKHRETVVLARSF